MKRHLLIFALRPGLLSTGKQTTTGVQAQVLQKGKPGAKFNSQKLLAMILLALFISLWSTVAMSQQATYYSGSGSYTVPPGVTQVTISAVGGAGGAGGQDCGNGCGYNYGVWGQYTSNVVSVSPGSTLNYYVGANGSQGGSNVTGGGAGAGGWGYYSGGRGGNTGSTGASGGGGGGGGASAVTTSGGSLLIVAGGGGGGGGRCNTSGSGTGGYTSTGGGSNGSGSAGGDSGGDGAGGGGGGGGYVGGSGGGHYGLNGEYAAYGGYSGSSAPSGSYSGTSPYIQISYTAVGGTASASPSSICSGSSATISLSGYAGDISWYYSTDGSNYYYYGSSATSFNTGNLTSARYYKALISGTTWSSVATVSIYALTTAPSSANCTGTTQSTASLSWGSGSGNGTITYYWVVGTSSGISYPNGSVSGGYGSTTGTSASASGLSANTAYYLRVYASATCGSSGYQTSGVFTTVPVAPVANVQTNVRANSFTANWSASAGGATGYYLDVSTSPTFATYISGFQNKNVGNVTSYALTGLNRYTHYYYRVRGFNSGGSSLNSNTIDFTTLPLDNFLIEKVGGGSIGTQLAGQPFSVRITARDAFNTTVTDYTGSSAVAITTNSVLTSGGTTANFTAGILASHSVTLTQSGANKTLTASKTDGVTSVTSTSTTFTVTPAALDHFALVVDGTITAGTAFTVTATAYDVYNNIKTNYGGASNILNYTGTNSVNWTTTAISALSGTARIIPANGTQTFANGVSAGITGFTFFNSDQSQLAPNVSPTITITDAATAKLGTTAPIIVLNAPLDNFKVVAGITQNAGVPFTATVTARDIYLNTCVDYEGSIRFKSSDDELVTFPSGLQSFAPAATNRGVKVYSNEILINKIGAYWLRAADATYAYKSGEQQNIVVSPGAFLKSAPISIVTIDSPNKIAGEEVVVTLTPRDAQGNLLYACQDISVLLDGVVKDGTHQVAHGTDIGSDGVYVFHVPVTSTTAVNLISAKLGEVPFDQTYDITVTPAPPSLAHTIITPDAGSMTTDGNQIVTVQLKDEFDNLRTTNDGEVTLTTNLGGFGGNNASQTVTATYNGTTSGSYSATLYASYSASNHGVGTAAITGSIAFNATPGPGVWSGAAWPANGAITDAASVAITEGLPNLVTSTFATDKTTMSTDGTATITVQLKDHLGNLIANNRGTVTLVSDRGVLTNLGYLSAGKYTATLTAGTTPVNGVGLATVSGSFTGTGSASGVTGNFNDEVSPIANTITTVDITEGLPAVAQIEITAAASPITADESTLITVQLKDALGNLVVNDRGTVTLSTNLGVIGKDATFGTTDIIATYTSAGKYTATFKMDGIGVGNATITGKYNTVAITDNAVVAVINGVATQLAILTQPGQTKAIAGASFNAQPVIHVKDQWGNLVVTGTGSDANVTATRITGTADLQGTTTKAAVAGVVTFTNLSYNVAESITIKFTSGSLTDQSSSSINVVHNVPSYMVISGSPTQTAGTSQTITIRAYDVYGNLATRFAGSKSLTLSGANLSPAPPYYPTVGGIHLGSATSLTFTAGEATASMILYKEETANIAANYSGSFSDAPYTGTTAVNINAALTNRLTVAVSQAAPAYLAITGSATQVAGEAQTITITAYDSFNNPATGYTGDKTLSFSGANVSLAPETNPTVDGVSMGDDKVVTFTNGVATASMVLYKVESISVMATDQAASGITTPAGYQLAVNVTHAPANYYAVTGSGTQTAGTSQNITVTAYDAFNNQATTYSGDVAVTFSGADPSPNTPNAATNPTVQNKTGVATAFGTPTTITFTNGVATRSMSLYNVETANIAATAGSITTPVITDYDYRLQVAVNHAANSYFAITGNDTQTAGESQDITLTMYDAYNNIATNYAGVKSLTFSGANPSPNTPNAATNPTVNDTAFGSATSLNFVAGTVTTAMNLYKVETALITATNGSQTADTHKLSVDVSHATPNFMAITGTGTQTAGFSQNITIKAYDAYNNLATGYDGAKSLTFSGASVSSSYLPTAATSPIVDGTAFGSPTELTFASGVVTTSMNLYKVETAMVTVTDGTIMADEHDLSVIVSHAAPAYLAVTGNATQVAGASQTITVTAYDAFNNIATGYSGSKSLTFTGANDAGTSPVTHPTLGGTAFGTPKSLTFTSGVATGSMTLYKTETALISANDGTINANSSESFDHRLSVLVTPTLLKDFLVYDVPDPNDLGTWQPVTVEARDTYNNRKTNYVGKITFSNTDISADNPLDYQFLLSDAGIHIFDNTSGNRGVKFSQVGLDWWLTAVDLAEPAKYGYQSGITVQRAVTITANIRTKTYGDALTMGTTEFTITDIVSGLAPIDHGITGVTLTSAGSAATATVAGSQYTITPSAATGTYTAGLYRIVYSNAGRLTVNKRDLTLTTFLANAKTYDGTTDVTGTGFSDNRVNSDALTFGYSAAFADKHAGAGKLVNYTGINISGGAGAGNYTLVTTSGTTNATISQRPINVTAVADSKVYDGSASSDETPTVPALQVGDLLTSAGSQAFINSNVGVTKTLTPSGTVINDGNSGNNYAITYVTSNTGTITQKELTVVNAVVTTKVYDGNATAAITNASLSGIVGSDDVVLGSNTTGTFASALVGTHSVATSPMTISGSKAGNYSLTQPILSGTITQKELTVVNSAVTTKVYDGNTNALITNSELSGVLVGDIANVTLGNNTTGTFASALVGTHSVATTPMTISGTKAANYSLTQPTLSGTITQKELTVVNSAVTTKIYDGNTSAAITGSTLSGIVGIDDVILENNTTGTFASALVGTHSVATVPMTISGAKAANYSLTQPILSGTITQKELTVVNAVVTTKTYDGNTTAAITGATLSGVVGSDDVVLGNNTAGTFSSALVGTHSVATTPMTITGTKAANYSLTQPTLSGTIAQKELTVVNAVVTTKTYDGNTTAAITGATLSGIVGSDEVVLGNKTSGTFASALAGTHSVATTPMTISGAMVANYSLTQPTLSGIITQKSITGNFTAANKVYDGNNVATILTQTLNGIVSGDESNVSLTGGSATFNNKNVANGKTVTSSGMTLTGDKSANYTLASVATTTANITPLDITGNFTVTSTKVYDGTTLANVTSRTLNGVIGADVVSLTGGVANYDTEHTGVAKTVTLTGYGLSGGDAINYNLTSVATTSASITQRTLTLSNFGADSKYYDGTTGATGIGFQDDRLSGDNLSFGRDAAFEDANIGTDKNVNYSNITISGGLDKNNYILASTTGVAKADIWVKPITVTITGINKVYDGNTTATVSLSGDFADGDSNIGLTYIGASFSSAAAQNGKTVSVTGIALTGTNAGNYSLSSSEGITTANITKKQLSITGITAQNKLYDGTTSATLTGTAALSGVVSPEVFSLGGTPQATFASATTGNGIVVNVTGYTISGAGIGNYTLVQPILSANITNATVTIDWSNPSNINYGTALSATQLNATANVPGTFSYSPVLGTMLSAGTHNLTVNFTPTDNVNYAQANKTVSLVVDKANLTVTANSYNKGYDGLAYTGGDGVVYSGFVNSETEAVLGGAIVYSGSSQGAISKGLYEIIPSGLTSSNYAISFVKGYLSVGKNLLTITANNYTKTYNGVAFTGGNGVTYNGFVTGDDENNSTTGALIYTGTSQNAVNAGSYAITPGGKTSLNYNIVFVDGTLTVNQASVHVDNAVAQNKEYDRTNAATITGAVLRNADIVAGDVITLGNASTGTFAQSTKGNGIGVSTSMTLDGASKNNYTLITPTGLVANITAKPLTILGTFTSDDKIYDGLVEAAITTSNLSLSGIISGDVVGLNTLAVFADPNKGIEKTVSLTSSTLEGINAGNYSLNFTGAPTTTASISTKELTVSGGFTALNKVYDNTTSASINNVTLTLNGVLPGDDVALTAVAAFPNANVGTGKVVSLTGSTLTGAKAGNYTLSFTGAPTATADITKKQLTVNGSLVANNKVYDKTTGASISNNSLTLVGVESGTDVTLTPVVVFADANRGDGKTVSLTGSSTLVGTDAGNYTLSLLGAPTATANITSKSLTISGSYTANDKVYDRTTTSVISSSSLSLIGIETGDVVNLSAGAVFADAIKGTNKTVNLTASTLTGSNSDNYSLSFTGAPTAIANITAKELSVSGAIALDKVYNGNTTATISGASLVGVIAGDDVILANSTTGVFAQASIGSDIEVSTSMTLSGIDAGNYTLTQPLGLKANILVIGQTITLSKGWNILSFNVLPVNADLKTIFQPLINSSELVKVMNESGSIIENVGSWVNDIGNSLSTEGYKVKVTQNTTLEVRGSSLTLPLSIDLYTGWNIISYPAQYAQNAKAAIQALIDDGKLIKVMDEAGNTIENVGGSWINDIGNFIPGEGYKVKVTSACTLSINEGPKSAIIIPQKAITSIHFEPIFSGNGFDHMNVYLTDLSASGIHSGDEIGVFDGKFCVGTVLVSQEHLLNGILNIPVSGNDGLSESVNGFTTGNNLKLKIYTNGQESVLDFKTVNNTSDQFVPGATVIVKASIGSVTGIDDLSTGADLSCYPNPFAEELTIEISQPAGVKLHIEVFDVMGRKTTDLYQGISTGYDLIKWNGTNGQGSKVSPGVYYVRCNGQVSKGIIKK